MPHASRNPAPVTATPLGPLKKSLLLHVAVLGLVLLLPYLHLPPKEQPPQVVEAVLVSAPRPQPAPPRPAPPAPEKTVAPVEPALPRPAPVKPEPVKPEPVKETPRIPLPTPTPKPAEKIEKKPELKPVPEKPAVAEPAKPASILKQPKLNTDAFEAEMRALEKEAQKQAMEAEIRAEAERANARARDAANLAIRDKYQRLINQRVVTKWNRPLSARNGMVTTLRITVLPGGEVSSVVTVKSSGDPAFDASAEEAVRRASPLPVPDDPALFRQYFSSITFRFNPEDL